MTLSLSRANCRPSSQKWINNAIKCTMKMREIKSWSDVGSEICWLVMTSIRKDCLLRSSCFFCSQRMKSGDCCEDEEQRGRQETRCCNERTPHCSPVRRRGSSGCNKNRERRERRWGRLIRPHHTGTQEHHADLFSSRLFPLISVIYKTFIKVFLLLVFC